MLQVASFDISDAKGMNELLKSYRLAAGAHILVSDGKVCIPYEDGEPMNAAQQVIELKEEKNKIMQQRELILHSQIVLQTQVEDFTNELTEAEANLAEAEAQPNKKGKGDQVAALKKACEHVRNKRQQLQNQLIQNDAEIARLDLNVQVFNTRISTLGS